MSATSILWTGRILSGIFVLFMLGASIAPKLIAAPVAESMLTESAGQ